MPWLVYTWDAENRLTSVGPGGYAEPPDGSLRAYFEYDYLGRRVSQVVEAYNAATQTWTVVSETKYVWAGWLMLMELDGLNDCGTPGAPAECVVRKYTWGLDLAGQMGSVGVPPTSLQAAGGIGGLLAVDDLNGTPTYSFDDWECVFTYDANGNVAQLVAWETGYGDATGDEWHDDRLVAHYEYDPYGNVTNDLSGYAYAETNRWRFSTKQFDAATGLGYWGYRYYDAVLGRWLSRDPIGEAGDNHLTAFALNQPLSRYDAIGLQVCRGWSAPFWEPVSATRSYGPMSHGSVATGPWTPQAPFRTPCVLKSDDCTCKRAIIHYSTRPLRSMWMRTVTETTVMRQYQLHYTLRAVGANGGKVSTAIGGLGLCALALPEPGPSKVAGATCTVVGLTGAVVCFVIDWMAKWPTGVPDRIVTQTTISTYGSSAHGPSRAARLEPMTFEEVPCAEGMSHETYSKCLTDRIDAVMRGTPDEVHEVPGITPGVN